MAKILVVDDSQDLLELFLLILVTFGHEVQTATSGNTMNSVVSAFIPDLILLDVMLGNEDGRELCRENKAAGDTPIILMSANPVLLKDFNEFGANDILEKPFDVASLAKKINTVLNLNILAG